MNQHVSSLNNYPCFTRAVNLTRDQREEMLSPRFTPPVCWGIAMFNPMSKMVTLNLPNSWTTNDKIIYAFLCFSESVLYIIDENFKIPSFFHDLYDDNDMIMSTIISCGISEN